MKRFLSAITLLLFAYILPMGFRPMVIPDETRYAEIPREMVVSGDWIVPHLNGLRYFEKPVMGYWLNAISLKLFGENPFAVRLPSAVSTGLTGLILFFLVRRFLGSDRVGALASAIYLSMLLPAAIGAFAVLDTMLSFFLTAALGLFFLAWSNRDEKNRCRLFLVLFGLFTGAAFLTKGFLVFVVAGIVIAPFILWEREWKKLFTMGWIPLFTALAVILPWALLIHHREPDFWRLFIWNEHIERFLSKTAPHPEPFYFFLMLFPLIVMPWSGMFPSAVAGLKKRGFSASFLRYALCWFLFPFLFFSASKGKLMTYILPCMAPFAILMAAGLEKYMEKEKGRLLNPGIIAVMIFFILLIVIFFVAQSGLVKDIYVYKSLVKSAFFLLGLVVAIGCLAFAVRDKDPWNKMAWITASPVLLLVVAQFFMFDLTIYSKSPGELFIRNKNRVLPDSVVVAESSTVHTACWFFKRSDLLMLQDQGELGYGLSRTDSSHRLISIEEFNRLVREKGGNGKVALVVLYEKYNVWKPNLPEPIYEDVNHEDGYLFAQY